MVDTSFTNSYVLTDTILEAYIGANPKAAAVALKALAAASQEWYCREATKIIDRIEFSGFKLTSTQARQFPRKYRPSEYDSPWGTVMTEDAYGYVYESSSVPQEVIDACCEEAIALYEFYNSNASKKRDSLQKQGVTSYSIEGLSETYGILPANRMNGLKSSAAYDLISKYIARSFAII